MFDSLRQKAGSRGRLLNEFLVSLALFFLILPADLMILSTASESAHGAAATRVAAEVAREGIEEAIAQAGSGKLRKARTKEYKRVVETDNEIVFTQTTVYEPLEGDKAGLARAMVTVSWSDGEEELKVERYVPGH